MTETLGTGRREGIRERARRESERLEAMRAEAAEALAPLFELVEELREVGIEASLTVAPPAYGSRSVGADLRIPAIHCGRGETVDWGGDDLALERYDLSYSAGIGTLLVQTYVPPPEEDPGEYGYGERPEPVWSETVSAKIGNRYGLPAFCDAIRDYAIQREMGLQAKGP